MDPLKKAFEDFYNKNVDKVYRFVYFRCQDKALTEDLVSEIFIKVLEHFHEYDEKKSRTAWLMTITKNHLANFWRDRKVAIPLETDSNEEEEKSDDGKWLKAGIAAAEKESNRFFARELLAKLKPEEAEIVTLHYLFGYSYSEIGEYKGMSEGAVKVAAHRIIRKLQSFL